MIIRGAGGCVRGGTEPAPLGEALTKKFTQDAVN